MKEEGCGPACLLPGCNVQTMYNIKDWAWFNVHHDETRICNMQSLAARDNGSGFPADEGQALMELMKRGARGESQAAEAKQVWTHLLLLFSSALLV